MDKELVIYPKKKSAPMPVCFLVAFGYVGAVIGLIVGLLLGINHKVLASAILLIVCACILISKPFVEKCFAWYTRETFMKFDTRLEMVLVGCLDSGLYRDKTRYTMCNITDVKKKGADVIVYGDCTSKESVGKTRECKFVRIYDITPEIETLLEEFKVSEHE